MAMAFTASSTNDQKSVLSREHLATLIQDEDSPASPGTDSLDLVNTLQQTNQHPSHPSQPRFPYGPHSLY